ncbi:hypothetical protein tb265_48530 [Gemmatimonadetes bacterium T265]|nr:hypothetical protein tb265_45370 [Gemmatimonadetes bacterium T265]GJG89672.1 hypothetical protein tb265_48530 [Gemmatimonadetes bacterium T265]
MSDPVLGSIPVGTSLAPLLAVRGGARAVAFYRAALGARAVYRVDAPDGAVVARLAVGDAAGGAEFWVADEAPEHGAASPETLGGASARLVLTVSDPDAAVARAVAAGAREVAPVEEAHGWRLGRVVDPFGHTWEIGRPLPDTAAAR